MDSIFGRTPELIERYKEIVIRIPTENLLAGKITIDRPYRIHTGMWPGKLRYSIPQQTEMIINVEGDWKYELVQRDDWQPEDLSYVELAQK